MVAEPSENDSLGVSIIWLCFFLGTPQNGGVSFWFSFENHNIAVSQRKNTHILHNQPPTTTPPQKKTKQPPTGNAQFMQPDPKKSPGHRSPPEKLLPRPREDQASKKIRLCIEEARVDRFGHRGLGYERPGGTGFLVEVLGFWFWVGFGGFWVFLCFGCFEWLAWEEEKSRGRQNCRYLGRFCGSFAKAHSCGSSLGFHWRRFHVGFP